MSESKHPTINPDDHSDQSSRRDWELVRDLKAFEAKLARLRPRGDRLNREQLAFRAGQASVSSGIRGPAAFVAMTAVAASLFGLLMANIATDQPSAIGIAARRGDTVAKLPKLAPRNTGDRQTVLSISDAYDPDIVRMLTQGGPISTGEIATPTTHSYRQRDQFKLTPSSWHRLLDEPKIAQPSSNDSSVVNQLPGANS